MALVLRGHVDLPRHEAGGFDHGDVHRPSGRVYVAHTATDAVEVIDGERLAHAGTVPGCDEASGVLCAQEAGLVFAAGRGAGKILVLGVASGAVERDYPAGPRPNGLAWDPRRERLLVAGVEDFRARLLDRHGATLAATPLPGRPRWCVFDAARDRFLVNVREPACVALLEAETGAPAGTLPVSVAGPHGLDLDAAHGRAFVACDGGAVVAVDLPTGREVGAVPISGEPDATWYNPRLERLYVAVGDPGVVDVVDCRGLAVAERVSTEAGAKTTAFDPDRQRLYVFLPRSGRAAVYDETTGA
jgi:DNA-binding beta-propeller fold protein YncE